MTDLLIFFGAMLLSLLVVAGIAAIVIFLDKACDTCPHSYERVDDYNDKKMILVCRRCGKIKKMKK